ncbi:hypothetical protein ABIB40_003712 [Pedobacter sp. UYP30]|uniref:hypothetical protein n=1 Tax=Pedobacter sp. UYP30 TaxID=1756400 RepID=UPI0033983916
MKKLILSAAFLAIGGLTVVNANEINTVKTNPNTIVMVQDSVVKTPVKLDSLPAAVTATLKTDAYKHWTPTEAWAVKDGEKEYFLINVKKEEQTGALKIDKDGKPVE